jgi:hypothetical protein
VTRIPVKAGDHQPREVTVNELFEDGLSGWHRRLGSAEDSGPTYRGERMMNLRKGLQNKAKKVAFGVGMGALLTIPVATMVSSTAGASTSTCYVGCSSPSTGLPTTSGDGSTAPLATTASAASTTSGSTGLAFTGADLSELVIISVGALGAGTVLVRFSRRRQTT